MSITLTERAALHVQRYLDALDHSAGLRLGVKPSGCSGFSYIVTMDPQPGADDTVFQSHGITIMIDAKSLPFLHGMEVDYVSEKMKSSFKFSNPNVKDLCGCGESFSI